MPSRPKKVAAVDVARPEDIHAFLEMIELDDVIVYAESSQRPKRVTDQEASKTEEGAPDLAQKPEAEQKSSEADVTMGVSEHPRQIEFRFRMKFEDTHGVYVADIASRYVAQVDIKVERTILLEFAQRVAFMTVYPFLRASIFASATRMGNPVPVLGLIRQGDFEVGKQMADGDVDAVFETDE